MDGTTSTGNNPLILQLSGKMDLKKKTTGCILQLWHYVGAQHFE